MNTKFCHCLEESLPSMDKKDAMPNTLDMHCIGLIADDKSIDFHGHKR
jgi:hypothetical protein